jgi:hypothetical protein
MLLNELQRQQRELADVAKLRAELADLRALIGRGPEALGRPSEATLR